MISALDTYRQAINNLDRQKYLDAFTEDAVLEDPFGSRPLVGRDGQNRFFDGMERTWRSFEIAFESPFTGGDRVAAAWTVNAESLGGRQVTFQGIDVFTVGEDGRITHLEGYWDMSAMVSQLK